VRKTPSKSACRKPNKTCHFGCTIGRAKNRSIIHTPYGTLPLQPRRVKAMRRAVLYLRVSTIDQTTANQERELREIAARIGCEVVKVYKDHGISGTRGRDKRPAFDKLCRDAACGDCYWCLALSAARWGPGREALLGCLSALPALRVALFLRQRGLDPTTPAGKAMFQMMGVFAEFERAMIAERVRAGLARARS